MENHKVILVTDGDKAAQGAVEVAAANIGARTISASAGNPTVLTGQEIVKLIKTAVHDPVVVMVDDRGNEGMGSGEEAMSVILKDKSVDVLGIVAVSSNGKDCNGLKISCSITKNGKVIDGAVDKNGNSTSRDEICGDTLSILRDVKNLVIVGIGDPGKMDFKDEIEKGAPITTMALKEIIKRSGYNVNH